MKNKRNVILSVVSITLCCLFIITTYIFKSNSCSTKNIEKLRETYPTFDENPPGLDVSKVFNIKELNDISNLVVIGEIIECLPSYKMEVPTGANTPEDELNEKAKKMGLEAHKDEFIQCKIKIDEYILNKNNIKDKEIVVINNKMLADFSPKFKEGEKALLFLAKDNGTHKGKYWTGKNGFFYITKDNLVLSALSDDTVNKYSGMNLKKFEKIIMEESK